MNQADKIRLDKLLGMLGSKFDGERANAASMIQQLAQKHGMSITELIAAAHNNKPHQPQNDDIHYDDVEDDLQKSVKIREFLGSIIHDPVLTTWERDFCQSVSRYPGRVLSEKQVAVGVRIADKIKRQRGY